MDEEDFRENGNYRVLYGDGSSSIQFLTSEQVVDLYKQIVNIDVPQPTDPTGFVLL